MRLFERNPDRTSPQETHILTILNAECFIVKVCQAASGELRLSSGNFTDLVFFGSLQDPPFLLPETLNKRLVFADLFITNNQYPFRKN